MNHNDKYLNYVSFKTEDWRCNIYYISEDVLHLMNIG